MRAGSLCRATLALLAPCWLYGGAATKPPPPPPDVQFQVIVVGASGRGAKPVFDRRIPEKFRKQLEGCHLAYTRYDFVGKPIKPARFGHEVLFPLPDSESLGATATRHSSESHPLRVAVRVLDKKKKSIQKIQMRVPYAKTFLIHRPKGPAAIIMGVSAHKPPQR